MKLLEGPICFTGANRGGRAGKSYLAPYSVASELVEAFWKSRYGKGRPDVEGEESPGLIPVEDSYGSAIVREDADW